MNARTSPAWPLAWFAALALVLALPPGAAAQGAAFKAGVFDKQRLVDESKLGLSAKARFEKLQAARESEVAAKQKEVEALQATFGQKSSVLSEDKRLDLQRDLARASDELKSLAANAERDLQRAYNSALVELLNRIEPVIAEYGKTEGFDLLFDKEQCAFSRAALEVTTPLLAKLDALYPQ